MAQKINNKELVKNSTEQQINSSNMLINFHNMVFGSQQTNHFWRKSFIMVADHKKVSQKVFKMVSIASYKVFLNKVVDHQWVQQKIAVHRGVSYKSTDHKLILIINYKVFPSQVADHKKDPVIGLRLVSFELKTFNCQEFSKLNFELVLNINILKKKVDIGEMHLAKEVDFEIC